MIVHAAMRQTDRTGSSLALPAERGKVGVSIKRAFGLPGIDWTAATQLRGEGRRQHNRPAKNNPKQQSTQRLSCWRIRSGNMLNEEAPLSKYCCRPSVPYKYL